MASSIGFWRAGMKFKVDGTSCHHPGSAWLPLTPSWPKMGKKVESGWSWSEPNRLNKSIELEVTKLAKTNKLSLFTHLKKQISPCITQVSLSAHIFANNRQNIVYSSCKKASNNWHQECVLVFDLSKVTLTRYTNSSLWELQYVTALHFLGLGTAMALILRPRTRGLSLFADLLIRSDQEQFVSKAHHDISMLSPAIWGSHKPISFCLLNLKLTKWMPVSGVKVLLISNHLPDHPPSELILIPKQLNRQTVSVSQNDILWSGITLWPLTGKVNNSDYLFIMAPVSGLDILEASEHVVLKFEEAGKMGSVRIWTSLTRSKLW